jgi:hypothetical protein
LPAQDEYDFFDEECFIDASGKPVLSNNTASCDIKISGIDKQVCLAMYRAVTWRMHPTAVPCWLLGRQAQ